MAGDNTAEKIKTIIILNIYQKKRFQFKHEEEKSKNSEYQT